MKFGAERTAWVGGHLRHGQTMTAWATFLPQIHEQQLKNWEKDATQRSLWQHLDSLYTSRREPTPAWKEEENNSFLLCGQQ